MEKSNLKIFVLSTLFFFGLQNAQGGEVVERDDERNRVFISIRLKFEVLKEIFLSTGSLRLNEEEILQSDEIVERDDENKIFETVNVDEIDDNWWSEYLKGLEPERTTKLTDDIEWKIAMLAYGQKEIQVEVISESERVFTGGILINEKTGYQLEIECTPRDDETMNRHIARLLDPQGELVAEDVSYSLNKKNILKKVKASLSSTEAKTSMACALLNVSNTILLLTNIIPGEISLPISVGLLLTQLGVLPKITSKSVGTYEKHLDFSLDTEQQRRQTKISSRKFTKIIRTLSDKLYEKL